MIFNQEKRSISFEYGRYGNPTTEVLENKIRYYYYHHNDQILWYWAKSITMICEKKQSAWGSWVNLDTGFWNVCKHCHDASPGSSWRAHSYHHWLLQKNQDFHWDVSSQDGDHGIARDSCFFWDKITENVFYIYIKLQVFIFNLSYLLKMPMLPLPLKNQSCNFYNCFHSLFFWSFSFFYINK